ncbi:MAG: adenylate/guanylate cyclase domain-containing protein [Solirubrobacteraceae bacterium]
MVAEQHTFLFADLAGFTALTEAHGDEFAADAVGDFCAGVRSLLGAYDAEEVKTIGDAIMVRTPHAAGGVKLAVEIIDRVGRQHGALRVRVGVHTGTAVAREGDWFGAGVNLSARVASAAQPGEVLMTAACKALAGDGLDGFELQYRGSRRFKNVSEPVELYALTLSAQAGTAGLPIDPVCRMAIDPHRSPERRSYRNDEYVFCSAECALIFDRHPGRYTGRHGASLELRVSSEARDRVTDRLQRAYRKGRLGENELERRVGLAMQARTREDLRAIVHDLPRGRRRVDRRSAPFLPLIILGRAIRRRYRRVRNWRRSS